jgi:hypothetical protein
MEVRDNFKAVRNFIDQTWQCKFTTDTRDIYKKLLFSRSHQDQTKCKFKITCSKTVSKLSLQILDGDLAWLVRTSLQCSNNNNNWMFLHFICAYHTHFTLLKQIIAIERPPFPTTQTGLAHILLHSFCTYLLVTLVKNCKALFLLYCILNMCFQKSAYMEDTKLFIKPVCIIMQCDIIIKCKII